MELEKLRVYQQSAKLSNEIWHMVNKWDFFNRDIIGTELIKSTDAVAANIAEGFGRYHYTEVRQYGYYARGALFKTKTWLMRAHQRNIIDNAKHEAFMKEIKSIEMRLNKYVNAVLKTQEVKKIPERKVA